MIQENNLIHIQSNNGQAVVSSRQVAEHFGKMHKDVLKAVNAILKAQLCATSFFYETTFKVPNCNKPFPEYLMNRDGFSLLAMGFTGKKALLSMCPKLD